MARAKHTDGDEPVRTRTVERGGQQIELPYCNICGVEMDEVRLSALLVWKPGFRWTRKYPLKYGAYLCEACREEMGFEAHSYIAVPCRAGEDQVSALRRYLAQIDGAIPVLGDLARDAD